MVSSLAATTCKLLNSGGAIATRDTMLKGEKATNGFISPKNNPKVNMGVNFTKKVNKSFLEEILSIKRLIATFILSQIIHYLGNSTKVPILCSYLIEEIKHLISGGGP